MTSPGSSTTQTSDPSRRSSWQIRQRGPSARLKQISHTPTRSLTSRIASASASASSGSARRTWKARRCAVRCPMPGSLPSSVIRRWTGGACKRLEARQPERAQVHPAGHAAELGLLELLRRAQALVDRGEHHVLQQLGVVGVDGLGGDRDRLDDEVAADRDLHHAAAGGGLHLLVLELLLRGSHVLLHLLDLAHHLLHVRLGHQAPPGVGVSGSGSGRISSAPNSSMKRRTRSSSLGGSTAAVSATTTSSRSSKVTLTPEPERARTASSTVVRWSWRSAMRRWKACSEGKATTTSCPRSSTGAVSASEAPRSWLSARTASSTAGHSWRTASSESAARAAGWARSATATVATAVASPAVPAAAATPGPPSLARCAAAPAAAAAAAAAARGASAEAGAVPAAARPAAVEGGTAAAPPAGVGAAVGGAAEAGSACGADGADGAEAAGARGGAAA